MSGVEFKEEDGIIFMEGVINERWDFIEFFKGRDPNLKVNMKRIRRINSTGVRRWTEALHTNPNLKLILIECPREIIDQCNMIPEFLGVGQVRVSSFYAHYYNEDEDEEGVYLYEEGTHYDWGKGIHSHPGVKEGMELDDNPNKYFRFISHHHGAEIP